MSRPKRLRNRSYVGRAHYFLTFCTRDRRAVFKERSTAAETLALFQHTANAESFAVLAYCLMPVHAHLLVRALDTNSDLQRFVKSAKERSGRAYRKRSGERLWQEGYFERVLRDAADTRKYADYIVSDPVRAGLVAAAADYEFVGTTEWMDEEKSPKS